MARLFDPAVYDTVRNYMPEEARRALERQVPLIRDKVDQEIDAFSESLGALLKQSLQVWVDEETKLAADELAKINLIKVAIAAPGASAAALEAERVKLDAVVNAYQARLHTLGKSLQTVVLTATTAAGLPPGVQSLLAKAIA